MPESTPLTRQLGGELRALRTLSGLSQRELANRITTLGVARKQPRVHRIEIGEAVPERAEVEAWLTATDAAEAARERIGPLLDAAHNPAHPWQNLLDATNQLQARAGAREEESRLVRNYQTALIPGLLQTAEYARQLFIQLNTPGADVSAQVAGRMERQQILYRDGRRFEFLIAEPALYWSPGADVMPAQLDRLASMSTLATVEIRILPMRRVGPAGRHSFVYYVPADDEQAPHVSGELIHAEFGALQEADVARYLQVWDDLWSAAASGGEARAIIQRSAQVE